MVEADLNTLFLNSEGAGYTVAAASAQYSSLGSYVTCSQDAISNNYAETREPPITQNDLNPTMMGTSGPCLLHFQGNRRWIGGRRLRCNLSTNLECSFPAAARQQNKEGICVPIHHPGIPGRIALHHLDGVLQRLPPRLHQPHLLS